jgi:large subunit ribosomal protein L25
MAQQVRLTVQKRVEIGRNAVKKVRATGYVPGVLYGAKQEPLNLKVSGRELSAVLAHAASENILVELQIQDNGTGTSALAMIQEVQHHPLKRGLVHVDFHAVSATEKVTAEVPIEAIGEALGVRTYGGLLEFTLRSLEVECLPKDLPEIIQVDVSTLNVGQSLHVRDLPLPVGVEAVTDRELTVLAVVEPKVEAEPEPGPETPAAPEVITAKRDDAKAEGAAP